MKDSKNKEHRISNLKEMINNVKDESADSNDEFDEDPELINYLNEDSTDYSELEIDDEFIYHPGDDADYAINLEEAQIDEDYIIKTPKEKDVGDDSIEAEDMSEDIISDVSENFDNLFKAKIGRTPIVSIISAFLGLILIAVAGFILQSRSDRVIDHVASGETNFIFLIVLIFGLIFFVYGIVRMFHIRNPFKTLTDSIDSIDHDKENKPDNKNLPTPQTIPKSNIPLDKDSYKIGEFDMGDLKNKLQKHTTSQDNKQPIQENLDDIPPAKEKEENKKGLTQEEIDEMEYNEVQLEGESIDDIFAEVEDIEDIPIISIDGEDKKE